MSRLIATLALLLALPVAGCTTDVVVGERAPDADASDADGLDADGPDADGPDADGADADGADADGADAGARPGS